MTLEDSALVDTVFDNALKLGLKDSVLLVLVKAVKRLVRAQDEWNVRRWDDDGEGKGKAAQELQDASDALRKLVQP